MLLELHYLFELFTSLCDSFYIYSTTEDLLGGSVCFVERHGDSNCIKSDSHSFILKINTQIYPLPGSV